MKTKLFFIILAIASLMTAANAEDLVILAVNDTHSQIDPAPDGKGGFNRRLAIYEKYRKEHKNVMVVHAGDAVQGSAYFSVFGGKVEFPLLDLAGYDIAIMGNHELDNGVDSLATFYNKLKTPVISTNYDLSATKVKNVRPYMIKTFDGKRIGFIGLNVNPTGMVMEGNFNGLHYIPANKVADPTAKYLKEVQKVDYVIAISHIGYYPEIKGEPCDSVIAAESHYIDAIIGGHTHYLVQPGSSQSLVKNADGKNVVIGQNDKYGKNVGVYTLNLENGNINYEIIPVKSNWDEAAAKQAEAIALIAPYKHVVDSLMNVPVCESSVDMEAGGVAYQNWLTDAVMEIIPSLYQGKVDFCIMNKGGIRQDMKKGVVTEGQISSTFPFDNRFVVMELTGKDLIDVLKSMAFTDGNAVSKQIQVTYNGDKEIVKATVNGKKINPEKIYNIVTITFLADGSDGMVALKNGKRIFTDGEKYGDRVLDYLKQFPANNRSVTTDTKPRFIKK